MDLYSISRTLWRHKFVALPLLLLTFVGCVGVVFVKAPTYTTTSTYILSPPQRISAANPFLNFGGLPIVAQELTTILATGPAQAKLQSQGATGSYTVAPSQEFGNSTPLIQVSATAISPAAAVNTADLVGKALVSKMNQMQAVQGVAPVYRIKTLLVTAPSAPVLVVSSKLRDLIAVFAIGIMLVFVAVSVMNALDERAVRRREARASAEEGEPAVDATHNYSGPEEPEAGPPANWSVASDSPVSEVVVPRAEVEITFPPKRRSPKVLRIRNEP